MANTLTGLIPTIYAALNNVSRELIGFIPNVSMDSLAESGAVGQTVRSPVVPQNSLEDITAGADPADSGDQTMGYVDVSIQKSKAYPIRWTGEEQLSTTKDGVVNTILADQFEQGFRTLANSVESDIAALYVQASRAAGTAGTTPFSTADDLTDLSAMNEILDANGAPSGGRVCILGSAARAKLEGKQPSLFRVNEAGDAAAFRRDRELRRLIGFNLGYSAGIKSHVKGTAVSYLVNDAGLVVGDTSIAYDGAGSGTFKAGDVVTFAGDANKYVVGADAAATPFVLNDPGLQTAVADNSAITVGDSYTANLAFHRNALLLAARFPAMPEGGDSADDIMNVVDPISGLTFQVAVYRQYRRVKYEIGLAWGVAAPNEKWLATLLG